MTNSLLLDAESRKTLAAWLASFAIDGAQPRRPNLIAPEVWRSLLAAEISAVSIPTLSALSDWYGVSWMDRLMHVREVTAPP